MEKLDLNNNNNKDEEGDDFIFKVLDFLKGKMSPTEAEEFVNQCLDDEEKLHALKEMKETYDVIKKVGKEYKEETQIKNLLNEIYGITLED